MGEISTKVSESDKDRFRRMLGTEYERELIEESAIDPAVAMERGYRALMRPKRDMDNSPKDGLTSLEFLRGVGFPTWAMEPYHFPGLWLPGWDVRGRMTPGQWKPRIPARNRDGKAMKYAGAKGQATRLDVHPRWTRDRGHIDPALVPYIRDVSTPLWITEGVKKADSLTSRDVCTVALSGVYNWRNSFGTLGDWEDIPLRGREVTICFDADARVKTAVAQAMDRLGRWLRSRGVAKVWYLVVPGEVGGSAVKGVDDYFAAGGTLKALENAREDKPPRLANTSETFTDAKLAETVAAEVLDGSYFYLPGEKNSGQWYGWNGQLWAEVSEVVVQESVRVWALDRFRDAADDLRAQKPDADVAVDGFRSMLAASKMRTVLSLARGVPFVLRSVEDLDADPDLLNTPSGVVDLRTGELMPHSPDYLMTKITGVRYNPDAALDAWERALAGVMPADVLPWFRRYIGQAATGHQTDDGRTLIMTGEGNAGKTMIAGAIFRALGGHETGNRGYAVKVPNTLLLAASGNSKGSATPEKMTLLGCRYAYIEETPEEGRLDTNVLKEVQDAEVIDGRALYRGFVSFRPTHSIVLNTNHPPIVTATDSGTWRRLARVDFPWRFIPDPEPLTKEHHRRADREVKRSMSTPEAMEACLAWIVAGAVEWYAEGRSPGADPDSVRASIAKWRHDSDVILRYLDARCEFVPDAVVSSSVLHADFTAWLRRAGQASMSIKLFTERLRSHSGLPGNLEQRTGVRFATLGSVFSMPPVEVGGFFGERPKMPTQGAAWVGLRFRQDPEG